MEIAAGKGREASIAAATMAATSGVGAEVVIAVGAGLGVVVGVSVGEGKTEATASWTIDARSGVGVAPAGSRHKEQRSQGNKWEASHVKQLYIKHSGRDNHPKVYAFRIRLPQPLRQLHHHATGVHVHGLDDIIQ